MLNVIAIALEVEKVFAFSSKYGCTILSVHPCSHSRYRQLYFLQNCFHFIFIGNNSKHENPLFPIYRCKWNELLFQYINNVNVGVHRIRVFHPLKLSHPILIISPPRICRCCFKSIPHLKIVCVGYGVEISLIEGERS